MVNDAYPLVNKPFAIENGQFIVDLPIKHGNFPWFFVCLPEGTDVRSFFHNLPRGILEKKHGQWPYGFQPYNSPPIFGQKMVNMVGNCIPYTSSV